MLFGRFRGARHASVRVFTVAAFLLSAVATLAAPTVAAAAGNATLTPSTFAFGVVPVGTSVTQIFTFSVATGTVADLPTASLAGANPGQFAVSSGCVGVITTTCILSVTFVPTVATPVSALLQVTYRDGAGGVQVATATLTGGPVNLAPTATTLVLTSPASATAGAAGVPVAARLTDSAGAPIATGTITFTACRLGKAGKLGDGSPHEDNPPAACTSATGTTNAQGTASAQLQLGPGAYSLTAAFAGDSLHLASSAVATLSVNRGKDEHDGEKADQDEGGASD